jgi:hypothetical protein
MSHGGQTPQLAVPATADSRSRFPSTRSRACIHLVKRNELPIRYIKDADPIGSGRFGAVYRAIDVDSGDFMAVKVPSRKATDAEYWKEGYHTALKNEVEALQCLRYVGFHFTPVALVLWPRHTN